MLEYNPSNRIKWEELYIDDRFKNLKEYREKYLTLHLPEKK